MNSKVKGLLKGLRYISQIFDANEEEEEEAEMQIGFPTDVKHVAHIGWDGPSVTAPSWMNEFRNAPLSSLGAEAMGEGSQADSNKNARIVQGSPLRDSRRAIEESISNPLSEEPPPSKPVSRSSRRHCSSDRNSENPISHHDPSSLAPRNSRRNKSSSETGAHVAESSESDGQLEDPHRRSRRQNRNSRESSIRDEPGTSSQDVPGIPKQARKKKKPKGSLGEGSSGSSTSSRPNGSSETDLDFRRRPEMGSVLKTVDE